MHRLFQLACIVTTPFVAGLPGYRTKLWMYDELSGDYAGLYEWDGADRADKYASGLVRILRALSERDSVSYRVYAGERLQRHLDEHAASPPGDGARLRGTQAVPRGA